MVQNLFNGVPHNPTNPKKRRKKGMSMLTDSTFFFKASVIQWLFNVSIAIRIIKKNDMAVNVAGRAVQKSNSLVLPFSNVSTVNQSQLTQN